MKAMQTSNAFLPFDREAERAVLGAILHKNENLAEVSSTLAPDHFFSPSQRDLYAAMLDLSARKDPLDEITLANFLRSRNQLEQVGGMAYIAELGDSTPISLNVLAYAEIVIECWQRRELIALCENSIHMLRNGSDVPMELVEELRDRPAQIMSTRLNLGGLAIEHSIGLYVDKLANPPPADGRPPLATAVHSLDEYLGRMSHSRPTVIAARPGIGKTALGRQIARNAANRKRPVLYVNLEMDEDELTERDLAALTGFDSRRLRGIQQNMFEPEEWDRIALAQDTVRGWPLYTFTPDVPLTGPRIESVIRWHMQRHGVELVIVDQLSKVEPGLKGNDYERQTARMRAMTAIVKHLGIPMILLCQLSRAADDARGGLMSALKSTGQIEEDAHVLIFLSEVPVEGDRAKASYNDERQMQFIIPKNGGGPKGRFRMLFYPKQCVFRELDNGI